MTQDHPKTIRFPAGSDTLGWYERHAAAQDPPISTNAALIIGLEYYRALTEHPADQRQEKSA